MLPEACPTRKWRASVSNIGLTLEEDPLLNVGTLHNPLAAQKPQEVELDPGCDRTHDLGTHAMASRLRLGCHSTHCVSIKFGGRNISIVTLLSLRHLQLRLLETACPRNIHSLCSSFVPRVFEVISQFSYRPQCVKAFSRDVNMEQDISTAEMLRACV